MSVLFPAPGGPVIPTTGGAFSGSISDKSSDAPSKSFSTMVILRARASVSPLRIFWNRVLMVDIVGGKGRRKWGMAGREIYVVIGEWITLDEEKYSNT